METIIIFRIKNNFYGLEADYITEIIRMVMINPFPNRNGKFDAFVNYRGSTIPIMDVCKCLDGIPSSYTFENNILVVKVKEQLVGMLIDEVMEIMTVEEEHIQYYKSLDMGYFNASVQSGSDVYSILNLEKMFIESENRVVYS